MSDAQNPSTRILMREQQIAQNSKAKKQGGADRMAIRGRDLNVEADFKAVNYPKSPDSMKFLDEALSVNFIFSDLNDREKMLLINAMQQHTAKKGDEIIKQGDVGDYFYIVEEGTTDFVVDGNVVGSCTRGASFGELALLYDAPRAASCVAATPCSLWKVDQTTFRHLLAKQNMDQEQDIAILVSKVPLLKDMDKALVAKFASVLQTVKFATDERIVQKGEQGDIFYILNEGQVKVHDIGLGDSQAVDQILKAGDWFGERALMTGEPRAANVTAMTDVIAFAVDRETFEKTIGKMEDILGHAARLRFLKSVPVFAGAKLLDVEYSRLVDRFKIYKFEKGQKLSEAGKASAHTMFIVKEGKLLVNNEDGNILTLRSGDYFGENAILGKSSDTSTDNCICEEKTVCWGLTRSSIEEVIGDVSKLGDARKFVPSHANPKLQLKDLKKHRILGMGRLKECCSRSRCRPICLNHPPYPSFFVPYPISCSCV
jgi:cAMP-dependent protein kinase regulator